MNSNLKLRLITAAGLVAAFLAALFLAPSLAWILFILAFMAGAAWEWGGLLGYGAGVRAVYVLATALAALLAGLEGLQGNLVIYLVALVFWVTVVPLWLGRAWRLPPRIVGALVGWLLLLPTFLALLYLRADAPALVLVAVGVAVVADSAAYFSGRAFGRRKLAPSISPGKTWEGALGAAAAIVIYALVMALATQDGCDPSCLLLIVAAFLLLFVLSVMGDLFESWIKRQAGVKDSGHLLPGHGGVLDRIDSLTATLPAATLFYSWMQ
jgi:phosphatidate cytidylyltransferase